MKRIKGDARGELSTGPFRQPGNCLGCGEGWSDAPNRPGPGAETYYGWHPGDPDSDSGHAPAPRRRSISGRY